MNFINASCIIRRNLIFRISEEKEDSETLQVFLEYWQEIAAKRRELALEDTEHAIFEEDSQTSSTVVTDWSVEALAAALKGQDPATLLNSVAGFIGKAMISSERDALADILDAKHELDAPWVDIVRVQQEPRSTTRKTHAEREPVADVTKQQREAYLAQPILELALSTRVYNSLENENIKTVRELVAKMEWDLMEYQNFGEKSLLEVQNRLAVRGLYLGMDLEEEDIE